MIILFIFIVSSTICSTYKPLNQNLWQWESQCCLKQVLSPISTLYFLIWQYLLCLPSVLESNQLASPGGRFDFRVFQPCSNIDFVTDYWNYRHHGGHADRGPDQPPIIGFLGFHDFLDYGDIFGNDSDFVFGCKLCFQQLLQLMNILFRCGFHGSPPFGQTKRYLSSTD